VPAAFLQQRASASKQIKKSIWQRLQAFFDILNHLFQLLPDLNVFFLFSISIFLNPFRKNILTCF